MGLGEGTGVEAAVDPDPGLTAVDRGPPGQRPADGVAVGESGDRVRHVVAGRVTVDSADGEVVIDRGIQVSVRSREGHLQHLLAGVHPLVLARISVEQEGLLVGRRAVAVEVEIDVGRVVGPGEFRQVASGDVPVSRLRAVPVDDRRERAGVTKLAVGRRLERVREDAGPIRRHAVESDRLEGRSDSPGPSVSAVPPGRRAALSERRRRETEREDGPNGGDNRARLAVEALDGHGIGLLWFFSPAVHPGVVVCS